MQRLFNAFMHAKTTRLACLTYLNTFLGTVGEAGLGWVKISTVTAAAIAGGAATIAYLAAVVQHALSEE